MTITPSTLLSLPIITTGTESGVWGDEVNNGLTSYLDITIAGTLALTSASFTANALTLANTAGTSTVTNIGATTAQYMVLKVSSLAANVTITAPSTSKLYLVDNADSTYTVTVKASGQTGYTVAKSTKAWVYYNGTDYVLASTNDLLKMTGAFTSGGVPYFSSATAVASSAALAANAIVLGGGAGAAPATTTTGTGVVTAIGNNTNAASGLAVLNASGYLAIAQGGTNSNATATAGGVGYGTGTAHAYTAAGTSGQVLTSNGASAPTWANAATGDVTAAGNNAFTGANTFYNSTGQTFAPATTNDGIIVKGRAGGTSTYRVTFTPGTLTASRTATFPDSDLTVGYQNIPYTTDKTANYVLATTDVGRVIGVGTGGSIEIPNSTFAAGDAVLIFNNTTGSITITCTITTAYIAGTDADKATVSLATRGVANILFVSSTVCVITGNVS